MLCVKLYTVCTITHCVYNYTLCVQLHAVCTTTYRGSFRVQNGKIALTFHQRCWSRLWLLWGTIPGAHFDFYQELSLEHPVCDVGGADRLQQQYKLVEMLKCLLFTSNLIFMLYDIHQHQHHLYITESALTHNHNETQIFIGAPSQFTSSASRTTEEWGPGLVTINETLAVSTSDKMIPNFTTCW